MEHSLGRFAVWKLTLGFVRFLKWVTMVAIFVTCFAIAFLVAYVSLFDPAPSTYNGLGPVDLRLDVEVPKPGIGPESQWSTTPLAPAWVVPVSLLIAAGVGLGLAWGFKVTVDELIPACFEAVRWVFKRSTNA